MSRFVAPDLGNLPKLPLTDPDYEAVLSARMDDFKSRAIEAGFDYDAGTLETDPIKIDQEVGSDREVGLRAEINDQVLSVMLASSWGPHLDHIAATYYGIKRLTLGFADDGVTFLYEKDADFKNRIALAPEAFSTAGPEGAYVFHLLELDGQRDIADAAAYSEEDGAVYDDDTPVLAPEIYCIILPTLEYAGTDQGLLGRAGAAVTKKDVRPIGDKVTVRMADQPTYSVIAKIKFSPGADPAVVAAAARSSVEEYVSRRRRISTVVQVLGLGGALKVTGVTEIELIQPTSDIDPGSVGAATCLNIVITTELVEDAWRTIQ